MEPTFNQVIEYLKQRRQMHCCDKETRMNNRDIQEDQVRSITVQQCIDGLKAMRKRMLKT